MAEDLLFRAGLEAEAFNAGIGKMLKSVTGFAAGFLTLGTAGAILKDIADKAIKNEAATYGLASAVKSLKSGTEDGFLALNKYAESMSATTGIAQDELKGALQKLVYETGNTTIAQKSLSAAIDLSRGAHIGLEAAAKMVGKAYEGNFQALKRYGIEIDKNATGTEALAKITNKFGGAEDSYLASTAGKIDKAKNSMSLLESEIGTAFLPALGDAANAVTKFLHSFTADGKEDAIKKQIQALEDSKSVLESGMDYYKRFGDKSLETAFKEMELQKKIDAVNKSLAEQKQKLKDLGPDLDVVNKKIYEHTAATGDNGDEQNAKQKNEIDGYKEAGKAFTELSSLKKTKSKEMFEVGKAASIGAIIASTAEAIMKDLALGPWGIPFSIAAGTAGAVELAAASSATFSAANGLYNDTGESMISTFKPQEMVIPSVFSQGIMSGKYSLHGGNTSNTTSGDTIIHVNAGNKSIDQTLREVKTYINNNRGGRLTRADGSLNV